MTSGIKCLHPPRSQGLRIMSTMDIEDTQFLSFWQRLRFIADSSEAEPSDAADAARGLLFQLCALRGSGRISSQCYASMFEEYLIKYSHILDEQDTDKGLKNFVEAVQSLTSCHKNDSESWKSGLSINQVNALPVWRKLIEPEVQHVQAGSTKLDDKNSRQVQDGGVKWNEGGSTLDDRTFPRGLSDLTSRVHSNNEDVKETPDGCLPKPVRDRNFVPIECQSSISAYEACSTGFGRKKHNKRFEENTSQSGDKEESNRLPMFISARQQYVIDCKKKKKHREGEKSYGARPGSIINSSYGTSRKTLGPRRGPSSKFVPPTAPRDKDEDEEERNCMGSGHGDHNTHGNVGQPEDDDPLKFIEPKMVDLIKNEIMDHGPSVSWNHIAGLEFAKAVIKEIIVWPMLRPDIFRGLRGPPKGILLFGPPGTGKTLIGKCIASHSKATFFSISASTLTSKWVGEGEKMVRALFTVARCYLPAVIFIDEIDSLLSQRTDGEHDASRRIKTEFLVQLDGATTKSDERLLIVGATNRPQEIDEAARRRLVKRLYIPLPHAVARRQIVVNLLCQQSFELSDKQIEDIVQRTEGYSGADVNILCREAALGPIRSISDKDIEHIDAGQVRPIHFKDFDAALMQVRPSVSPKDLTTYIEWNKLYGSGLQG